MIILETYFSNCQNNFDLSTILYYEVSASFEITNSIILADCMVPRKADVMFCLSIILCALNPNFKHLSSRGEVDGRGLIGITSTHGSGSHLPPENFTKVVFLGENWRPTANIFVFKMSSFSLMFERTFVFFSFEDSDDLFWKRAFKRMA